MEEQEPVSWGSGTERLLKPLLSLPPTSKLTSRDTLRARPGQEGWTKYGGGPENMAPGESTTPVFQPVVLRDKPQLQQHLGLVWICSAGNDIGV